MGDALTFLNGCVAAKSVDVILTSPPFALRRKKAYGNPDASEYLEWFRPFAASFKRVLRDNGSLIIDIGGSWTPAQPTRSLYHFELLIMLCADFGFHLAQDFYWWKSGQTSHARRVGYGAPHPRQGCRQLPLVAFAHALAQR